MREPLKDKNRLEHMITSMNYINEFMEGITYDEFKKNKLVYFAVIKNYRRSSIHAFKRIH